MLATLITSWNYSKVNGTLVPLRGTFSERLWLLITLVAPEGEIFSLDNRQVITRDQREWIHY